MGAGPRRRAAPEVVRARRRGLRARSRVVSPDPADRLAAARGRDAGAVRRPEVDSGPLRHGSRPARRRASPLPVRLDRRAHGRRSRRPAARVGDLRDGDRAGRRAARQEARRPADGSRSDGALLGQLDAALPRRVRAHVQPVPVHERALVPRAAARQREADAPCVGAVGDRDAALRRGPPVRRARAGDTGRLRRAHAGAAPCRRSRVRDRPHSRHPVLAYRSRARRALRRRRRQRVDDARQPGIDRVLPRDRRGRLHRGLHPGDHGRAAARPRGLREPRPARSRAERCSSRLSSSSRSWR